MRIKIICLFIVCTISCDLKDNSQTDGLGKEKIENIENLANRYRQLNRFSGNVTIADEGKIIYNQYFGFADFENKKPLTSKTIFKVGEISKVITKNIAEQFISENKFDPSDKISKYLPNLESNLTIHEILNQNNNSNFNNLGKLLEKVSNKSFTEIVDNYSSNLKLEDTYYEKIDSNLAIGHLYQNHRGQGLEIYESPIYDLKDAFSSKGIKSTGKDLVEILNSNSKDIELEGYIDDDGFSYSISNDATNKLSIILLSNQRHPVSGEISKCIKAILQSKEYELPLLREPFNIDKTTLEDFVGKYSINEFVNFEIFKANDSLFVQMGPNKINLIAQSQNQFYMEQMDAAMRFKRDSTGFITYAQLLNGFVDSDEIATRMK